MATEAARPGGTTDPEKTDRSNKRPTGTQGIEPRSHTGSGAGTGILAGPEPGDEGKERKQLEGPFSTCWNRFGMSIRGGLEPEGAYRFKWQIRPSGK